MSIAWNTDAGHFLEKDLTGVMFLESVPGELVDLVGVCAYLVGALNTSVVPKAAVALAHACWYDTQSGDIELRGMGADAIRILVARVFGDTPDSNKAAMRHGAVDTARALIAMRLMGAPGGELHEAIDNWKVGVCHQQVDISRPMHDPR